ncbi:ABC transporter permease subunit [Anaerococcus porci]|uniref:ABC transporter permease n=1 Tax=Anaerococcus porci TaxID=2652269 RepID=UPI002A764DA9|nr:ABC transporter permease subunit [Anaerococcus porci]MDY3006407.1 ABC transporter permease subunit [Anaerococcus porci]
MTNIKKNNLSNNSIKRFMPIIFGIFAILEYLFMKNHAPKAIASPVYLYFLVALLALYGIFFLISLKNEKLKDKLSYMAAIYSFFFIILIIYDILTLKTQILPLPYFAWIDMIFNSMIADKGFLLESLLASLKLLFTGYFIGAVLGIITGIFAGYSRRIDYWVDPFLKLLGPIPTTTWIPIVMVLATSLFAGAVFIISLGVWFQTTLATMTGIKNVDKSYYEVARTLGANENELVRKIAIPSATPNIFQGLISAMSSACTSLIVAEMLGVESGLGWYITWKSSWADYSAMYGAIILLALTFIVVNLLLKKISNRVLIWQKEF